MKQAKYVWDITVERDLSKRQLELTNMISTTIVHGGNVRYLKKALQQLDFEIK